MKPIFVIVLLSFIIAKDDYTKAKASAESKREYLVTCSNDSISKVFTRVIVDEIFPHWYGTKWDFNGHTDIPQEGQIACGYFVSTTLKHMGLNLNRYRLAQQGAKEICESIALGDKIKFYKNHKVQNTISKILMLEKDGLYVVGLDNHVGFLLVEKGQLFFIHSSYTPPVAVVKEMARDSEAFANTNAFYLARVSNNEKLMQHWVKQTEIPIIYTRTN